MHLGPFPSQKDNSGDGVLACKEAKDGLVPLADAVFE